MNCSAQKDICERLNGQEQKAVNAAPRSDMGCFFGRGNMYTRDRLHLSRKGAAMFADELSAAVDSGMSSITNIFGSTNLLN